MGADFSCWRHECMLWVILHWHCELHELYQLYCMLWFVPCQFRVTGGLKDTLYCTSGVNLTETLLLMLLQLASISLRVIYISPPPWLTEFYTKIGWNCIYPSPVKVESTFVMRTLKSQHFSLSYTVKPVLSVTWVWRKPVLSGKILVKRIRGSSTCIKRNLPLTGKCVLCGSVIGRFHCTPDRSARYELWNLLLFYNFTVCPRK